MWYFRKMFAVLLPAAILYIYHYIYIIQVAETERYMSHAALGPRKHIYVINSPTCKIPELEPFDFRVQKYFHVQKPKICSQRPDLTQQRGNMLILNLPGVKNFCRGKFTRCEYRTVIRVGDFKFKYSPAITFKRNTVVTSEFIRVKCFCAYKDKVYTNFHAFVHAVNTSENLTKIADDSKGDMLKLQVKVLKPLTLNPNPRLNVVMIGLDSISRLNSYRQLSDTRNFLLHKLGGIELKGYNKVADNTFVNLIPILLGKYIEEMPWSKVKYLPFDKYDLMWAKYHRHGYKTLYAEDYPLLSTFYLGRKGFTKTPTDHYLRPMSLAMEKEQSVWRFGHHCVNGRLEVQLIMQYISDFVYTYKSEPHFSFSFFTRLSHDEVNLIGVADYAFKAFFQKLHNEQLLNDTLLFFFSDHGIRFGDFRKTTQGKLEESLPMMYIVPPKWFPKRFPGLWKNLRTNSRRLTTPFDIHETLKAVLNLNEFQRNISKIDLNSRGVSLFAKVPENRTCESATIKQHWCACQQGQKLPVNDSTVVKVARLIVAHINQLLRPEKDKCVPLKLDKVQEAVDTYGVNYRKTFLIKDHVYQLTLRTTPGMALFEATVKYKAKRNKVEQLGDISRTNKYGSQSSCTSRTELKKYCYCK